MNKLNIFYIYLFLLSSYIVAADLPESVEKPSKKQKAKKGQIEAAVRSISPEIGDLSEFIAVIKELNSAIGEIKPTLVALKPYIDQIEADIKADAGYVEEDAKACCPRKKN